MLENLAKEILSNLAGIHEPVWSNPPTSKEFKIFNLSMEILSSFTKERGKRKVTIVIC